MTSVNDGTSTLSYYYDNAGNLTGVTRTVNGVTSTSKTLSYSDSEWGDLLTSYNGVAITYDRVGNPLSYYNGSSYSFAWEGRRLVGAVKGGNTMSFTYDDEGLRTSKTVNGVKTTYYWNGTQLVAEVTPSSILVYLYESDGSPLGMKYLNTTSATDVWETYWFEKNIQGDVVAIYSSTGTKLISYKYDAWGSVSTYYHNGGGATSAVKNSLRYRGYYYDTDLDLYYLQSRYYSPVTSRFINPDTLMSGANGSLHGANLFVYCFNNPVNMTDAQGNWPSWNEFWNGVGDTIYNIGDAIVRAIELEVGLGFGLGFEISNNITADISRDTYVRFDDGVFATGNVITMELSLFDSDVAIGNTYDHLVEKGGKRVSSSASAWDGPFDMINYPDVTHGNQLAIGPFIINGSGDFLIGYSASVHLGGGGHASAAFNFSELVRRLFD